MSCGGALGEPATAASFKSSDRLQSAQQRRTLASMSDHGKERDGGGLAVAIVAGLLVLLLLCGGAGVWVFVRQSFAEREAMLDLAAAEAEVAQARAERAQAETEMAVKARKEFEAAQAAIEIPAPSAPESPPPTQ